MATCPECEETFVLDEFDVDTGDSLSCPECGANVVVTKLSPLELEPADEEAVDEGFAEDDALREAEGDGEDELD